MSSIITTALAISLALALGILFGVILGVRLSHGCPPKFRTSDKNSLVYRVWNVLYASDKFTVGEELLIRKWLQGVKL